MNRLVVLWAAFVACGAPQAPQQPPLGSQHVKHPSVVTPQQAAQQRAPEPGGSRPPVAQQRAHEIKSPNGSRNDPYYWLRDDTRKDAGVLAYLDAENKYSAAIMGPQKQLEDTLFNEMRARIKEDDSSVPILDDGYW